VANYGPQVSYLNRMVGEMVDRIRAGSLRPAVIIIQGDHGAGEILQRVESDQDQLARRHAILNAICAPQSAVFYDSITPVNTFRILLPELFDTALALLPDRSCFSTLLFPYRFEEIGNKRGDTARQGQP